MNSVSRVCSDPKPLQWFLDSQEAAGEQLERVTALDSKSGLRRAASLASLATKDEEYGQSQVYCLRNRNGSCVQSGSGYKMYGMTSRMGTSLRTRSRLPMREER